MFPVLSLPLVAFENVYRQLQISDIILLSQCSKHTKTVIRSMEKSRGTTLKVSVLESYSLLRVLDKKKEDVFTWRIGLEENAENETFVDKIIEGKLWRIAEETAFPTPGWVSPSRENCIDQDTLFAFQSFQDVFQCPIEKIKIRNVTNTRLQTLLQNTTTLHTAYRMNIYTSKLSTPGINFILDTLNSEYLHFLGDSKDQYSYEKPILRFPKLSLYFAQWVTPAWFLEMAENCKRVGLWDTTMIADEDLNQCIRNWLAGTNEILEKVTIVQDFAENPWKHFDKDVVLNGVEYMILKDDDSELEVEVKRRDGKMARAVLEKEEPNPNFYFTIVK